MSDGAQIQRWWRSYGKVEPLAYTILFINSYLWKEVEPLAYNINGGGWIQYVQPTCSLLFFV